jgi:hypothetical protein
LVQRPDVLRADPATAKNDIGLLRAR